MTDIEDIVENALSRLYGLAMASCQNDSAIAKANKDYEFVRQWLMDSWWALPVEYRNRTGNVAKGKVVLGKRYENR